MKIIQPCYITCSQTALRLMGKTCIYWFRPPPRLVTTNHRMQIERISDSVKRIYEAFGVSSNIVWGMHELKKVIRARCMCEQRNKHTYKYKSILVDRIVTCIVGSLRRAFVGWSVHAIPTFASCKRFRELVRKYSCETRSNTRVVVSCLRNDAIPSQRRIVTHCMRG
jgi:hypothetical protein